MMADTCDVRSVLLEIIGRKVFNCIKYGGEDALTNFIGKLDNAPQNVQKTMHPIEVVVDNAMSFDDIDKPSTSSSVFTSKVDVQQDVKVYNRIAELRSAGLWSASRLPMCVEPPRQKVHWDFLLEEVLWMSKDFAQERRIKSRLARKLCSEAKQAWRKKFDPKENESVLQEKEGKRICSSIAKMVKEFWRNVDKVVDFRTNEILNTQKRKVLDQHLMFLVDEADKLSSMLHERLCDNDEPSAGAQSSSSDEQDSDDDEEDTSDSSNEEDMESTGRDVSMDESSKDAAASGKATPSTSEKMMLNEDDYSGLKSKTSEARRRELNNIAQTALEFQPKGYTLETTQVKTDVPFLLRGSLREYQLVGLDWLVTLYEKNLNGILADEMGLGKTIQTVALLAHLACERSVWGPHLIIVPTSVILNWEMEFKKWCPSFKILTYFGSAKERAEKRKGWSKPNAFHVCITSYKIASQDIKALKKKAWQYLILDEAHNIKNFKSQRWQTLLNIRSRRRLLLTGTPLQNSLMELWSLLHFLMPAVFASHEDFKDWFSNPMTNMVEGSVEVDNALVQRLHKVLRPFILRRLKCEVEKQLPTKQEKIISCALSKRQRFLYNEFLSKKSTRENLQTGNMMSVLNIIMQLRKCCNHPNLFEARPVVSPLVIEPLRLELPSLTLFLQQANDDEDDKKCFEKCISSFSEWKLFQSISEESHLSRDLSGAVSNEVLPKIPGLKFSIDQNFGGASIYLCTANVCKADDGNDTIMKDETVSIKPSEKVVRNGRKRPAAVLLDNEDKVIAKRVLPKRKRSCFFEDICATFRRKREEENRAIGLWLTKQRRIIGAPWLSYETILALSKYIFDSFESGEHCSFSSKIILCGDNQGYDTPFPRLCRIISKHLMSWMEQTVKDYVLYVNKVFCEGPLIRLNLNPYSKHKNVICEQISCRLLSKRSDEADAVHIGVQLQFPELRLIEYDCGKLQVLSKLLFQLYENKHRCLIFTQMSKMLDILQAFLSHHNYKYFRLDGSTHIDQRQAMMERFNMDSSIFCFILSTRSGGIGVNLTGADTVIFYDSDWNPTMDAQAQDRCHRIGQTRNVTIYRLISEKTIEENILKKAMQKRRLGEMALDQAEFTPDFFRNSDNIRDLFSNEESVAEIVASFSAKEANTKELEMAMANAEDQQDVLAAKMAQAEARVDAAEFDENASFAVTTSSAGDGSKKSGYLRDIESPSDQYVELINSMTPVERYAVNFLENEYRPELEEEVKEAEALIEAKKEHFMKNHANIEFSLDSSLEDGSMMDATPRATSALSAVLNGNDTYDEDFINEVNTTSATSTSSLSRRSAAKSATSTPASSRMLRKRRGRPRRDDSF